MSRRLNRPDDEFIDHLFDPEASDAAEAPPSTPLPEAIGHENGEGAATANDVRPDTGHSRDINDARPAGPQESVAPITEEPTGASESRPDQFGAPGTAVDFPDVTMATEDPSAVGLDQPGATADQSRFRDATPSEDGRSEGAFGPESLSKLADILVDDEGAGRQPAGGASAAIEEATNSAAGGDLQSFRKALAAKVKGHTKDLRASQIAQTASALALGKTYLVEWKAQKAKGGRTEWEKREAPSVGLEQRMFRYILDGADAYWTGWDRVCTGANSVRLAPEEFLNRSIKVIKKAIAMWEETGALPTKKPATKKPATKKPADGGQSLAPRETPPGDITTPALHETATRMPMASAGCATSVRSSRPDDTEGRGNSGEPEVLAGEILRPGEVALRHILAAIDLMPQVGANDMGDLLRKIVKLTTNARVRAEELDLAAVIEADARIAEIVGPIEIVDFLFAQARSKRTAKAAARQASVVRRKWKEGPAADAVGEG